MDFETVGILSIVTLFLFLLMRVPIAIALGIFLILSPKAVLGALLIFVVAVAATRYISLGSILAAMSAPLMILMLNHPQPIFLATLFIATLVIWRHRTNIRRLLDGTENRFKA